MRMRTHNARASCMHVHTRLSIPYAFVQRAEIYLCMHIPPLFGPLYELSPLPPPEQGGRTDKEKKGKTNYSPTTPIAVTQMVGKLGRVFCNHP